MNVYTVESSNKYVLSIEKINSIEEAGDDFVTEEELREMLGLSETDHLYFYGRTLKKALITEELTGWKEKLVASGKKTIVCTDDQLIEALSGDSPSISQFVSGLRRVGNRIWLHEKTTAQKTTAGKKDFGTLVALIVNALNKGQKFRIDMKYAFEDRVGALTLLKKTIEWDDLLKYEGMAGRSEDQQAILKQVWDNPAMFND